MTSDSSIHFCLWLFFNYSYIAIITFTRTNLRFSCRCLFCPRIKLWCFYCCLTTWWLAFDNFLLFRLWITIAAFSWELRRAIRWNLLFPLSFLWLILSCSNLLTGFLWLFWALWIHTIRLNLCDCANWARLRYFFHLSFNRSTIVQMVSIRDRRLEFLLGSMSWSVVKRSSVGISTWV